MSARSARKPRTKKTNVLSLHGAAPPVPTVCPSVVEKLEELLERARNGNVVGFAYLAVDPYGMTMFGRCGMAPVESLIAGTARLHHSILADDNNSA